MEKQLLHSKSYFIEKNIIWCLSRDVNSIIAIDTNTWEQKCVCYLESDEDIHFHYMVRYKNYAYCISTKGCVIAEYDMEQQNISYYKFDSLSEFNVQIAVLNEKIYIFPRYIKNDLLCFDLQQKKICEKKDWARGKEGIIYLSQVVNDHITLIEKKTNRILQYNFMQDKWNEILHSEIDIFSSVCEQERYIYVATESKRKIIRINKDDGEVTYFVLKKEHNDGYNNLISAGNRLYLMTGTTMDCFNELTGEIDSVDDLPKDMKNIHADSKGTLFFDCCSLPSGYLFISWNANMFLLLDKKTQTWKSVNIEIPFNIVMKHHIEDWVKKGWPINEENISLSAYLKCIAEKKTQCRNVSDNMFGLQIYKRLKE